MDTKQKVKHQVAVVGAGTMGGRVVRACAAAGHFVTVVDIDQDVRAQARSIEGVSVADHVKNLAPDLMFLSLPGPTDVTLVVDELAATLPAGTTVLDLSTIDPATARTCAGRLASADVVYLDCPVLGRPERVGNWTLVVGGESATVAPFEDVLIDTIAARVICVGGVGLASIVKLMNNLMFGAINAITAEVLMVCTAAGLDPAVFVDTVLDSGAAAVSPLFRDIAPRIVAGDFSPTFALSLLHKDNRLAVELADRHRVPLVVGHSVQTLNGLALAENGPADSAAVIRTLERLTGVQAGRRESP